MLIVGVRWHSVPASVRDTIVRSVKRRPALAHTILSDAIPNARTYRANSVPPSWSYDADGARIIEWLEALARGILYHHYRRVMNKPVWVLPEFSELTPQAPGALHIMNNEARNTAKEMLSGRPLLGDNPKIFTYRYCEQAVELSFYSSKGAFVLFE
ncbi:hypothetical protein PQR37_10770 [Paraburkholderia nemoris]|uniref:hypothetical protein n=1 Tax=Paraburkholderia nemoris TaxID=2793076 RepID=UPI0038B824A5